MSYLTPDVTFFMRIYARLSWLLYGTVDMNASDRNLNETPVQS